MFVYVGMHYTSSASGDTIRRVTCEGCGDVYYYKMYRSGTGVARSAYMIDNAGAAKRATKDAAEALDWMLKNSCDPVACPTCGRFQPDMVARLRRLRFKWIKSIGLIVPFVAFLAFVFWAAKRRLDFEMAPGVFVGGLLLPVALWAAIYGLRRLAERGYDPNKTRPKFRRPPPKPLRLLNPPEDFSPQPTTDLYFTSPQEYEEALATGRQVPLEACWVQPAARAAH